MNSLISFIFCALAFIGVNAFAQSSSGSININTEDLSPDRPKTTKKIEKVEIIGSHIKRTDIEGPSPVQTFDRQYIEKTGYSSAGDILREVTASSFGGNREDSLSSNFGGGSTVSLRGLGASRTLVLINGKRVARDGAASAADLSLIPAAAIERMEILKDGASALYGSEALGGVVNIVTKKNYVGTEVTMRQELTEKSGGERRTISLTHGDAGNRWHYTTSFQYKKNEAILSKDRAFSKEGKSKRAPFANYTVKNKQAERASPNCDKFDSENLCTFNHADFSTYTPEMEQFNNITTFGYDIMPGLELTGMVKGTYKELKSNLAPGAVRMSNIELDTSYYDDVPGYSAGDLITIEWRSEVLGNREKEERDVGIGGNLGLKKEFGATWDSEITIGSEQNNRKTVSVNGYSRRSVLEQAVKSGQIDVFKNKINTLPDDIKYIPSNRVTSELTFGEVRASGELFDNWVGPVSLAVGSGYNYEKYSTEFDQLSVDGGVTGGGAGSIGSGSRQSQFAYTELAMPLLSSLELSLAGRVDRYSDFGTTINPRAALSYRPANFIMFRASGGTGFKAPNMDDIHLAASSGFPATTDTRNCDPDNESCPTIFPEVTVKGNNQLNEERSESYNLGVVIEPIKQFNISVDYFVTKVQDGIGTSWQGVFDTFAEGGNEALEKYNSEVTLTDPNDPNSSVESISTGPINISETEVTGFDVSIGSNFYLSKIGTFNIANEFSYLLSYETSNFPGNPIEDAIGTSGAPRWKNNISFNYAPTDRVAILADWYMVSKHQKDDKFKGELPQYTSMDLQVLFQAWIGSTITLGAKNVLGEEPPHDRTIPNDFLVSELYDPIGRRFFASYTQRF